MKNVNMDEATSALPGLLAEVERRGQRFVICRDGKPIADLIPHRPEVALAPDARLGAIKMHYDPTEEVDEADWPLGSR